MGKPEMNFRKTFLRRLMEEHGQAAMMIPLTDTYQVSQEGRPHSQRRPFDEVVILRGVAHGYEFKFERGKTFNVEEWLRRRPNQVFGLWFMMLAGGEGRLAIRFSKRGEAVYDIKEIVKIDGAEVSVLRPTLSLDS